MILATDVTTLTGNHTGLGWDLNPMTVKEKFGTRGPQRRDDPHDEGGIHWREAAVSPGMPRVAGNSGSQRRQGKIHLWSLQRESSSAVTLILDF